MYFLIFKDHNWSLLPLYEFVLKFLPLLARFRSRVGEVPFWIKLVFWALWQGEPSPSFPGYAMIAVVEMKPSVRSHCFVLLQVAEDWLRKAVAEAWCHYSLAYCRQLVGSDTNLSLIPVLHGNNVPAVPCILPWYCNVIIIIFFLLSFKM